MIRPRRTGNRVLIEEVTCFDTILCSGYVVVHSGVEGKWQETTRQVLTFQKKYLVLFSRVLIKNRSVGEKK